MTDDLAPATPSPAFLRSLEDNRTLAGVDPLAAHAAAADWLGATAAAMRSAGVSGSLLMGDVLLTRHLLRRHGLELPYGPTVVREIAFFALGAAAEAGPDPRVRLGVAEITDPRHAGEAVLLLDAAVEWCRQRAVPESRDAPPPTFGP